MNLFTEFVALDIGTATIKFLSMGKGKGGGAYLIDDFFQCQVPPGLICGGLTNPTISDIPVFQKLLQKNLRRLSSTKGGFLVGLPDRWVKLHLVEMHLKESEIKSKEYLSWRLRKLLPLPEDMDFTIDQQILSAEPSEDGFKCKVVAGAVESKMLDLLSRLFVEQKMEVMGFDSSSGGLYNLLEDIHPEGTLDRPLAIIHAGHDTTGVKVFHSGKLAYERIIEVAGDEIGRMFAEAEHIPVEKAHIFKTKKHFFPENREELVQALEERHVIEKVFGNWLRELNVTFRFYLNKFQVRTLPHVYLTGGTAMFRGLETFLGDYFGTNVEIFNPLEEIPFQQEPESRILKMGPVFAASLGLLSR